MRRNDTYRHGLLKSLDLHEDVVELAVQALLVSPYRVGKAPQEGRKEDSGKNIFVRPAYELQKAQFNNSGEGMSVDGARNECGSVCLQYDDKGCDMVSLHRSQR
jgi:hypothetical protein